MALETQEIQYDNLRVHAAAADKLREAQRRFKEKEQASITQSEMLTKIADYYIAHELAA